MTSVLFATIVLSIASIGSAQVKDLDVVACASGKGHWIWIIATANVPGDGSRVLVTAKGPPGATFLGGHADAYPQNLDKTFTSRSACLMNPAQPPTVASSQQRRCAPPCDDISVEKCSASNDDPSVTCEYVNAKDAPNKKVVLGACFMPPATAKLNQTGTAVTAAVPVRNYEQHYSEEARLHDLASKGNASALQQLKALANDGNLEAAFQLSILYSAGQGVPNDPAQSVTWGRKAAQGGHAEAQANLGTSYAWGRGVAKDLTLAASWFRKAAEQGNVHGQLSLGAVYRDGRGVPKDLVIAYMWMDLAAQQGPKFTTPSVAGLFSYQAKTARDEMVKQMSPAQIAEAQRRSRDWKPKQSASEERKEDH
jgi:hypothetical protein